MHRKTGFLLTAVAVLLSSTAIARADTTYTVTSVPGATGTLSGTITGNGMTVTSFDLTAVSLSQTLTFDSADAGSSGSLSADSYNTLSGAPVSEFSFANSQSDYLFFDVTGDFTSGLAYVTPQIVYLDGGGTASDPGYALFNSLGRSLPLGNFTLTPDVATTPEPSSWLLLATGLAALGLAAIRRNRLSLTRNHHHPGSLCA